MEKKEFLRETAGVIIAVIVFAVMFRGFLTLVVGAVPAGEEPGTGVGRVTETMCAKTCADEYNSITDEKTVLQVYTEGVDALPAWWSPEDADIVWEDEELVRTDGGCPDYNIESVICGWDGHTMESWEMETFSRIFYLEFWQPNVVLCEAGCDAMLRLWEKSGGTMYESLSRVNENGSYAYSTFPGMWDEDYDPDGLDWCRAFCEERFSQGPVWEAEYFRKGQYHDWGEWSPIPAYEIDGIYFSVGR